MKNIKILFGSLVVSVAIIAGITACQKEEPQAGISKDNEEILSYLVDQFGFDRASLQVKNGQIIAENDIVFPITNFWENYGKPSQFSPDSTLANTVQERKHYKHLYLVSTPNPPRVILVNALPSVSAAWNTAISNAISAWNARGLNVRFAPQCGTIEIAGAINVKAENLNAPTVYASGQLPTGNGNPGYWLKINTNGPTTTAAQKTYAIVHELGHTIGFRHTDGGVGTWITGVSSPCKNNTDPSSVMQGYGCPAWSSFSTCDKEVFNFIY
ncbi:MAG: hypothetical protein KA165_11790 [Saprospiraceae bacterium]|nr:hypothetical protein [Saprospiraceae bacterium]